MKAFKDYATDIIVQSIFGLINAFWVWLIWPWVMVETFHLPELPFVKAWWLCAIGSFLTYTRGCNRLRDEKN